MPESSRVLPLLAACLNSLQSACSKSLPIEVTDLNIAGSQIQLCYYHRTFQQLFNTALAQHKSACLAVPELTVHVVDQATAQLPATLINELYSLCDVADTPSDTPISFFRSADSTFFCGQVGATLLALHFFDQNTGRAYLWIDDLQTLTRELASFRSSPFRTIFAWHFLTKGKCLLHASAIGNGDGAVLVLGPGGAGKSTAALSCVEAGMEYLGDDSVLVSVSPPIVHNLYSSMRITPADIKFYPSLAAVWTETAHTRVVKHQGFLHPECGRTLALTKPIRALIVPSRGTEQTAQATKISPAQALKALLPSTLLHVTGNDQQRVTFLSRLARAVPCFALLSGNERLQTASVVESILHECATSTVE